ncbi:hypothetical protein Cpir12675_002765 [Ceratocystis pirilliformis]|uniref:Uncharacterized protein n=1 Tax=Ceratocystis pirilliformis TaxID=259994 RepID=A0ABR3Z728_9PEZI
MRLLDFLSLSFLLVGVNAQDTLKDHGYTFNNLGDGLCTITSHHYSKGEQPLNEFKVSKADKTIAVDKILNHLEEKRPDQLSVSAIMTAVCQKYGLSPDGLSKAVIKASKDTCLEDVLSAYRWLHPDVKEDEKVVATITLDKDNTDFIVRHILYDCYAFEIVAGMLTSNSIVGDISIEEGNEDCSISYFINPSVGN